MADEIVFDRFNPPGDDGIDCSGDPGKTQQEFRDEVDINRIMRRVIGGGEFPPELRVGSFGDFSEVPDFRSSLDLIRHAEEQFQALPALVRDRFQNDAAKFLEWAHDPNTKLEEAEALGILRDDVVAQLERDRVGGKGAVTVPPGTVVTETLKTS